MIEVIRGGIDWYSSSMHAECASYAEWRNKGVRAIESLSKEGYQIEGRRLLGYEGISAGNCFFGENERGSYLQLTGEKADRAFDSVYSPEAHVSRIDVQTTVKYDVMPKNIAKGAYREAIRANADLSAGRRRKVWIIVGSDGGDTAYIGSASSEERGRIYNKEVQSEDVAYTRSWRYEAVFRNDHATAIARSAVSSDTTRADWAIQTVAAWFLKRGVSVDWFLNGQPPRLPIIRTLPTDIERKLNWLRHQVRPTVEYLLQTQDKVAILELLGLS